MQLYLIMPSLVCRKQLFKSRLTPHLFTYTYIHTFNGLFSRTTWVSRHQKGKPFWILLKHHICLTLLLSFNEHTALCCHVTSSAPQDLKNWRVTYKLEYISSHCFDSVGPLSYWRAFGLQKNLLRYFDRLGFENTQLSLEWIRKECQLNLNCPFHCGLLVKHRQCAL